MYLDSFAPEELHARNPFPVDCQVEVIGIAEGNFEPDFDGVIVEVRGDRSSGCKKRKGLLPLQDLEVQPKDNPNYWPVREFVVWYANRCSRFAARIRLRIDLSSRRQENLFIRYCACTLNLHQFPNLF